MKYTNLERWSDYLILKDFCFLNNEEFTQVCDCLDSNVHSDILMNLIKQEENKFLNTINWINLARQSGKTKTSYELLKSFIKEEYNIEMPKLDVQE